MMSLGYKVHECHPHLRLRTAMPLRCVLMSRLCVSRGHHEAGAAEESSPASMTLLSTLDASKFKMPAKGCGLGLKVIPLLFQAPYMFVPSRKLSSILIH